MPTYEYRCPKGHEFELFQRMSDEPRAACPECGKTAQRLRLEDFKARRDSADTSNALEGVRSAASSTDNLLPPMIEAVKASVSLGEISEVLREEWGTHDV